MTEFLPWFAAQVATVFPELDGRAIAVSDMDLNPENPPTKPIALIALATEKSDHKFQGNGSGRIVLSDEFVCEFWFDPLKYQDRKGVETPFWRYYNFEDLRNKFLTMLMEVNQISIEGGSGRIEYTGLDVESTKQAVMITFRLTHHTEFCPIAPVAVECEPSEAPEPLPLSATTFSFSMPSADGQCKPETTTTTDPCAFPVTKVST